MGGSFKTFILADGTRADVPEQNVERWLSRMERRGVGEIRPAGVSMTVGEPEVIKTEHSEPDAEPDSDSDDNRPDWMRGLSAARDAMHAPPVLGDFAQAVGDARRGNLELPESAGSAANSVAAGAIQGYTSGAGKLPGKVAGALGLEDPTASMAEWDARARRENPGLYGVSDVVASALSPINKLGAGSAVGNGLNAAVQSGMREYGQSGSIPDAAKAAAIDGLIAAGLHVAGPAAVGKVTDKIAARAREPERVALRKNEQEIARLQSFGFDPGQIDKMPGWERAQLLKEAEDIAASRQGRLPGSIPQMGQSAKQRVEAYQARKDVAANELNARGATVDPAHVAEALRENKSKHASGLPLGDEKRAILEGMAQSHELAPQQARVVDRVATVDTVAPPAGPPPLPSRPPTPTPSRPPPPPASAKPDPVGALSQLAERDAAFADPEGGMRGLVEADDMRGYEPLDTQELTPVRPAARAPVQPAPRGPEPRQAELALPQRQPPEPDPVGALAAQAQPNPELQQAAAAFLARRAPAPPDAQQLELPMPPPSARYRPQPASAPRTPARPPPPPPPAARDMAVPPGPPAPAPPAPPRATGTPPPLPLRASGTPPPLPPGEPMVRGVAQEPETVLEPGGIPFAEMDKERRSAGKAIPEGTPPTPQNEFKRERYAAILDAMKRGANATDPALGSRWARANEQEGIARTLAESGLSARHERSKPLFNYQDNRLSYLLAVLGGGVGSAVGAPGLGTAGGLAAGYAAGRALQPRLHAIKASWLSQDTAAMADRVGSAARATPTSGLVAGAHDALRRPADPSKPEQPGHSIGSRTNEMIAADPTPFLPYKRDFDQARTTDEVSAVVERLRRTNPTFAREVYPLITGSP